MSGLTGSKLETVLDAAQRCLHRHGVRKTTMEDIARAAGMSRPAVYQYVRNRDDAFRRLAAREYQAALVNAEAEAIGDGRWPSGWPGCSPSGSTSWPAATRPGPASCWRSATTWSGRSWPA